jgi:hypothetical protein
MVFFGSSQGACPSPLEPMLVFTNLNEVRVKSNMYIEFLES